MIRAAALRLLAALALLSPVVLAGCGILPDWLGSPDDDDPLPGERISILTLERSLEPDPDLAGTPVALPPPWANRDWPQPGGNARNDMGHIAGRDRLEIAWRASAGEGESRDRRILSTPVAAAGRVFTLDAAMVVTAFAADTGRRLWRSDLLLREERRSTLGGGIAYDGGRLYVTTGYGHIVALDAENGREVWRTPVGGPLRASPTVAEGRVFAVSFDNRLHVLSAADGAREWDHTGIAETAGLLGAASPAVADGVVVAPYSSGEVFAFRVEDGRELWSDTLILQGRLGALGDLMDIDAAPVIVDGIAYTVSYGGRVLATDLDSGQRIWNQEIAGRETPWVAGDWLFLVTIDADLVAVRRDDGRVRWVRSLERWEDPEDRSGAIVWSGPVLLGDRLILTGSHGVAVAVSPYTGELLGRQPLSKGVRLPPIIAGGTVYLLTEGAELVALR